MENLLLKWQNELNELENYRQKLLFDKDINSFAYGETVGKLLITKQHIKDLNEIHNNEKRGRK